LISTATFTDLPELVRIINGAYRGDGARVWTHESELVGGDRTNAEQLREMMAVPGACFLVRRDGDRLAGCVYLKTSAAEACYLGLLSVDGAAQQQGLGRALLAEAERFAREELGCRRMWMSVIHQRPELIDYYRRRGYEATGETQPFPVPERLLSVEVYFDILAKNLISV
jgi:ribosomal protein S18 acetylase RimI-like enzyme